MTNEAEKVGLDDRQHAQLLYFASQSDRGVVRHPGKRELGMIARHLEQQGGDRDEHRGHPGQRSDEEPRPERALHGSVRMRYPSPRTVSIVEAPSFRRRRAMNTSTVFKSRSKVCA